MFVGHKAITIMDGMTVCPHCQTRFRVAGEQLAARGGMVRCGQCMQAFDARLALVLSELETAPPLAAEPTSVEVPVASPAEEVPVDSVPVTEPVLPEPVVTDAPAPSVAAEPVEVPTPLPEPAWLGKKRLSWRQRIERGVLATLSLLLFLTLFAQLAYFFRVELAVKYPNLKPLLVEYCRHLYCHVGLPQNASLMTIESSELEVVPHRQAQIILHALLRNRAEVTQAFPHLELTLNDEQDKPLTRRILRPAEYLSGNELENTGLGANQELPVKVRLNIHDLKATGYRLSLFYPAP